MCELFQYRKTIIQANLSIPNHLKIAAKVDYIRVNTSGFIYNRVNRCTF